MEHARFDSLTRILATRRSRREAVKALVVAAGSGAVAMLGGAAGAAGRCKAVGQVCKTTADCCPIENNNYCDASGKKATCQHCAHTVCAGACVDTTSSADHCGGCNRPCATTIANATATCAAGQCSVACDAGYKACNSACIPSDVCCGACASPATCNAGECCVTRDAGEGSCLDDADCCGTDVCDTLRHDCGACVASLGGNCTYRSCCAGLTCHFNPATGAARCE